MEWWMNSRPVERGACKDRRRIGRGSGGSKRRERPLVACDWKMLRKTGARINWQHHIRSGAETPKIANPLANTVPAHAHSASRAVAVATSGTTTRWS
jgi:hypothetical protein